MSELNWIDYAKKQSKDAYIACREYARNGDAINCQNKLYEAEDAWPLTNHQIDIVEIELQKAFDKRRNERLED